MNISLRIDLLVFSTLIPLTLIIYTLQNINRSDISTKLFLHVLIISFLMSLVDALAWIPNGINADWARTMNIVTNIVYFALCTLPAMMWVSYFDYKITNDQEGLNRRKRFYAIPTIIGCSIIPINAFTGLIYTISEANEYIRGPFNSIYLVLNYSLLLISLLAARKYWKLISGSLIQVLMFFVTLPIIGALIQQFFYGVTLTYPLLNLTALLAFIYLEKDTMLKDSLTHLYTRIQFEARLKYKLKRTEPFSVLLIDLNDFKQINDNFGHDEGDKALIILASILLSHVKRGDMVCRYGGDEFTLLIESPESDAGTEISRRIENAVEEFNSKKVHKFSLKMSFGIKFINSSDTIEGILTYVDRKMYEDKSRRKKA